ncbi:hypothetical protein ACFSKX_14230 [Microbulbifer halophilus]|uniref:Uncharacterized protein n=1 Tax=Microbulbifer halophilus TaxID=453963 RepID=A0ABW5EDQ3_9GAMM
MLATGEALGQSGAFEQPVPALYDLQGIPLAGLVPIDMEHNMVVVAHHRIAADIQREDLSQLQQAILDPLAAVVKRLSGTLVLPAQKGTADTAGYAMVVRGRVG